MVEQYQVVSPLGEHIAKIGRAVPRLDNLNGKTICDVWSGHFRGDDTFPLMREQLKKRYPDVNIIPYTEFPFMDAARDMEKLCKELKELLVQKRADAAIVGNGA